MGRFRIASVAELARQMLFAPRRARSAQLEAAEALLRDLDPAKAYPYELVVYRITGYRPRTAAADLLTGLALQHDLGLLIEQVSRSLDLRSDAAGQPVLGIDDVAARFNVTSKTIQRWRRRGLAARRFIFPDGKRRVGFLLDSVERFLLAHGQQVAVAGANLSPIHAGERDRILCHGRRLAAQCGCWPEEIARRIACRLGRSPLAILHTIKQHDQQSAPQQAILPLSAPPPTPDQQSMVLRGFRRGATLSELGRRIGRPRCVVYRILLEHRIARLNRKRVRFIDDPLYHQPDAETVIESLARPASLLDAAPQADAPRIPRDLPPYLRELYRHPLLSPAQERGLFLKLHYWKFRFAMARRRIEPQFARAGDLALLESLLRRVTETRNAIVRANLRLVVSVARNHVRPGLNLMELISDGNLSLLRAVESFDVHRGNRFSTYATFALMKGFARSVPIMQSAHRGQTDPELLAELPDGRDGAQQRAQDLEQLRHLLSGLSDRERAIVLSHYGVGLDIGSGGDIGGSACPVPVTYEQLGRRLGLSKQRIRQIEQSALAKLRARAGVSLL